MREEKMWGQVIRCPKCGKELEVDSIREHKNGRRRIYWECKEDNLSIMDRGVKNTSGIQRTSDSDPNNPKR